MQSDNSTAQSVDYFKVEVVVQDTSGEIIDLPRGKELREEEAIAMAVSRPVQWVVIAGAVRSGKTTLLSCLYDMFQWNRIPNFLFAGSSTLPAFEERCHLSRAASGNIEPDTYRTLYTPLPTYLHLRVGIDRLPQKFIDFLFADVSGEMFEHVRDSTTECRELTFLRRAGNFVLLLDSKQCLRLDKRWKVAKEAQALLQSCLDSEMLDKNCVVNVVWSKFDYFVSAGDGNEHREFRDQVEAEFRESFQARIAHLKFGELAARPSKAPELGFGKGILELLEGWITFCPRQRKINLSPHLGGNRESDLFAKRHYKAE